MRDADRTLTIVPGLGVGHTTGLDGPTGCTRALCQLPSVSGVDQRREVRGTREPVANAIVRGVEAAEGLMGLPAQCHIWGTP